MNEKMPEGFPHLTLPIMRSLCALSVVKPGQEPLIACLDPLFEAYWVRHEKTTDKDVLAGILTKALGEETAKKGECFLVIGRRELVTERLTCECCSN